MTASKQLLEWVQAPIHWNLLQAALELRVFDFLLQPVKAAHVAEQTRLNPDKLGLLLDALASLGILHKRQQRYQLAEQYQSLLSSDDPRSMVANLLHMAKVKQMSVDRIKQLLAVTPSAADDASDQPRMNFRDANFWQTASDNLLAFHRSTSNDYVLGLIEPWADTLAQRAVGDWQMLDLGAGSETLASSLLERYPALTLTLQYRPQSIDCIRQRLDQLPADSQTRLNLLAGDFNKIELGGLYDLVWSSMALYFANDLDGLLMRLKQQLKPGGVMLSLHEGLYNERTQPGYHVLGRFAPAMNGNDLSFNQCEIHAALQRVGFQAVATEKLATPFGPMELTTAQRAL